MEINEQMKDKIRHVANLPTLPQVASSLIRIINDPTTSSNDAAFVVGQDLSLSAKVLRLANSAFYGIPRSITNINSAVVILGLKVLNTIVLSLTVFDMFKSSGKSAELFDHKAFWLHSLSCGLIAKFLASRIRKFILFDPEEAFCAGLLHDIGKVVMEQYMHEEFHKALKYSIDNNVSLFEAEQKTLNFTHSNVAEWLTQSWGLPIEIQLPLIYHHTPSQAVQSQDIIALCHFADWLCYEMGLTIDKRYPAPQLDLEATQVLKLDQADIDELKVQFPKELERSIIFYEIAKGA
jgi:HD-like signal output (HDOD) protein